MLKMPIEEELIIFVFNDIFMLFYAICVKELLYYNFTEVKK